MKYTQENIDKLQPTKVPMLVSDVAESTGFKYNTVRDALTVHRTGKRYMRGKNTFVDKDAIWKEAVKQMKKRGLINK